eukprot:scaffold5.g681.t1
MSAQFTPGEPPPPFAAPPADQGLLQRITKLVEYGTRNGPGFIDLMRQNQGANPEYAFLVGGEGADYFAWALWCQLNGRPTAQPLPGQAGAPAFAFRYPDAAPAQPPPAYQQHQQPEQHQPYGAPPHPQAAYAQPHGGHPPPQPQQYASHPMHAQQAPQHQQAPQLQQLQQQYVPPPAQQQQQHAPQPGPVPPEDGGAAAASLPAEVASGWQQVLAALTGSRESVRQSQAWFMACAPYSAGMAELMLQHVLSSGGDYSKQLHALYLANDILFKAHARRSKAAAASAPPAGPVAPASAAAAAAATAVGAAFRPRLGRMLRAAYVGGGATEQARAGGAGLAAGSVLEQLGRMVDFWGEKGVFDAGTAAALAAEMKGEPLPPPAAPTPAAPAPPAPPLPPGAPADYADAITKAKEVAMRLQQKVAAPGAAPLPPAEVAAPWAAGTEAPPPGQGPPAAGRDGAAAYYQPPPPQQQPYPYPPGGAPPVQGEYGQPPFGQQLPALYGLIPKLVEEKLKTDEPYTPLTPEEVAAAPAPAPPRLDAYLKARLDKFYAQLADYRPGMLYGDIEVDATCHRHFSDRGGPGEGPPPVVPLDDGSFPRSGPGGPRAAGLGYGRGGGGGGPQPPPGGAPGAPPGEAPAPGGPAPGAQLEGDDLADALSMYRRLRSGSYHTMIMHSAAKRMT